MLTKRARCTKVTELPQTPSFEKEGVVTQSQEAFAKADDGLKVWHSPFRMGVMNRAQYPSPHKGMMNHAPTKDIDNEV